MNYTPTTNHPIRLCRIVTIPLTFKASFWGQLRYLTRQGFDVTLVSSSGAELYEVARDLGVAYHAIEMARDAAPWQDLRSLVKFTHWLWSQQFDMIHSSTPKAGLIAALAGRICSTPVRVHTYTGQVWVEMTGVSRKIIKAMDVIIGRLNNCCLTDSPSQRQFLIDEGVVAADKLEVIGAGSVAGVDLERFNPQRLAKERVLVRQELQIDPSTVVICYLGRLRADKGINELVSAFQQLQLQSLPVELLLVGPTEFERKPVLPKTLEMLKTNAHIHITGYTSAPEKYLSAADLFCFPSYREGFPTSVIEAAAMGLPTVAFRIQGCVDSVVDGVTGCLVPAKDAVALAKVLHELVTNADLRKQMGQASQVRAAQVFDAELINRLVANKYQEVFGLCNRS